METALSLTSEIFYNQQRKQTLENDLEGAKEILGTLTDQFTLDELKVIITEIKYLAESWLDDFERGIFDGKTLNELLNIYGGL